MELNDFFPGVWEHLTPEEQETLLAGAHPRSFRAGELLHNGSLDCNGLYAILSGQVRVYLTSDEGREITLYRLFERDLCLFSASCMMKSIQFEVTIAAERDTETLELPTRVYQGLMERSTLISNFTNALLSTRFSEVMWLMDQILFRRLDSRLAAFLTEERNIDGGDTLLLTHEKIAAHLGTAREVVTRMLKYFQSEGLVRLSRGAVTIVDARGLERRGAQ